MNKRQKKTLLILGGVVLLAAVLVCALLLWPKEGDEEGSKITIPLSQRTADQVQKITVENELGSYTFERTGTEEWTVPLLRDSGVPIDRTALTNCARYAAELSAETLVAEDLEKALADLCRTVAKENKVDFTDVKYVGIGTPGSVNFTTGFVGFNTNLGYYDWNLGPDLEAMLGCKVYVENDANAAAYGEYIAGGAKGYKDAVVITLGTGIGSGIILGGKILRGFNFAAGEMGHNVIVKDGIQCTCGRKGCWERYASASALTRETKVAMQAHKETIMWKMTPDIDHVNAKLSFDAAAKGDAVAKSVVDSWIEYVGVGIANVINTFEPEVICIGGGVSNQGETLLAPVRAYAENETKNITTGRFPKIVACTLHNDAGVIGAAALENSI